MYDEAILCCSSKDGKIKTQDGKDKNCDSKWTDPNGTACDSYQPYLDYCGYSQTSKDAVNYMTIDPLGNGNCDGYCNKQSNLGKPRKHDLSHWCYDAWENHCSPINYSTPECDRGKYACQDGKCVFSIGGPYDLSDCEGECGTSGELSYDCVNGVCRQKQGGKFYEPSCGNTCSGIPSPDPNVKYGCSGTLCVKKDDGKYTNEYCDGECREQVVLRYKCDGINCVEDKNGIFMDKNCGGRCNPVPTDPDVTQMLYDCFGSDCKPSNSGKYKTSNCDNKCISTPSQVVKYGCSGSKCQPMNDGKYDDSNCKGECSKQDSKSSSMKYVYGGISVLFVILLILAVFFFMKMKKQKQDGIVSYSCCS